MSDAARKLIAEARKAVRRGISDAVVIDLQARLQALADLAERALVVVEAAKRVTEETAWQVRDAAMEDLRAALKALDEREGEK